MDNPEYHVEQFAKRSGLSKQMSLRATLLRGYAGQGKGIADAAKLCGIAKTTAQQVARKLIIDFSDYRPYAAMEKKGLERPKPFHGEDNPAENLPLFGGNNG